MTTDDEIERMASERGFVDPVTELEPDGELHRGQLRMAERFVIDHTGELIYAHGIGWHVWDGTRWARDIDGAATRAVVATIKATKREVMRIVDEDERKRLYADACAVESSSGLYGVLKIAGSLQPIAVAGGGLDADPWLFNATNGTLDLRTGEIRPQRPADLITKVAGCALDLDATAGAFEKFVMEILPDLDVRDFVQRLMGYAMLGRIREHVLPIFTGTGQNGKSTLVEVVRQAFGDYAITTDPELLVDRAGGHPTGMSDLLGVRLAVTAETDEGRRLASATVKRLTGGDKIRARRMRQDFFEFDPSHTIVMVTNHKPRVAGDDPALWRRLRVVPFDVVVANVDTTLPERLQLELSGVLAWAYAGYLAYVEHGLTAPTAVTERTDAYRSDSDPLGRFLDERTLAQTYAHVRARELYGEWSKWCSQSGEVPGSEVEFAGAMAARGFSKTRQSSGQTYTGIGLLSDETEDEG